MASSNAKSHQPGHPRLNPVYPSGRCCSMGGVWVYWAGETPSPATIAWKGPGSHWFPVLKHVGHADQYTQRHGGDQTGTGQCPSCLQGHLNATLNPGTAPPFSMGIATIPERISIHVPAPPVSAAPNHTRKITEE